MKNILLLISTILIYKIGFNQFSYTFSAAAGAYTAVAGATNAIANTDDDVISAAINIGFTFNYGCTNYTQFKVSSNGWMTFNTGLSSSNAFNDLDATGSLILAPLWDDLQCTANVKYRLTGSAPNRVLTVEWGSMEWYYGAGSAVISFQVKLYETTNLIEFVYNQNATAVSSGSASIGINGPTVGQFYSLNNTSGSPSASTVTETTTISTKPANGQIYRWTPAPVCAGVPVAGTALASVNPTTCASPSTTLSLSGNTNSCGITYQWQSSPNNSAWTNIAGATNNTYSTSLSVATYYRCVVTCTNSSSSANSTSVLVNTTATPPANDECVNATTVTVNPSVTCVSQTAGTIACSSASAQANSCGGTADDDVWFRFQATNTTQYINLNNITGSTTDLYHTVYSGACGALSASIICSDPESSTVTGLAVGTWYYLRVYSWTSTTGQTSNFNVCITTPPPPPPNNNCAGATAFPVIPVDGTCSSLNNQYTNSATDSGVTPTGSCTSNSGTPDDDVWFSFVASATTLQLSSTLASGTSDIYFQVFTGNCASTNTILCTDTDAGGTLTGLTVGTTYRIRMYTWSSGVATVQNLCLRTPPPPPPNSTCSTPAQFCPNAPVSTVSVTGASAQAGNNYGCLGSQPNPYWYYFTVNTAGNISIDLAGTSDMDFILYGPYNNIAAATADCGTYGAPAGEIVDCSFNPSITESIDVAGAVVGKVYSLLVTNYANVVQTFTLNFNAGSTGNCGCTPMPIDLLTFEATNTNSGNLINWVTASERDNDYFLIEKSSDNILWEAIKLVKGQGNSIKESKYSYLDKNVLDKNEYYRLKQVDFNGNFTYSNIISILKNNEEYKIYNLIPNPTDNTTYTNVYTKKSAELIISIIDNSGRTISNSSYLLDKNFGNKIYLNSENLNNGVYTVKFDINNGEYQQIQKLVKK